MSDLFFNSIRNESIWSTKEVSGISNSLQEEVNNLTDKIQTFWGDSVKNIQLIEGIEDPFMMFTLTMELYGKHEVKMEYDRSTLNIMTKIGKEYVVLSKLTDEQVFWGFEGYKPENLLHNFKALDNVLKAM